MLERARRPLGHNALLMFGGQSLNLLLQVAFFLMLARLLGATQYGVLAGAVALTSLVAPYSSLGSSMLFMRYGTDGSNAATVYWGNALAITTACSLVIAAAFGIAGPIMTGSPSRLLYIALALANCLFSQVVGLAANVFQSFERMRPAAALTCCANASRLLMLLVMRMLVAHATAVEWSIGVLVASLATAVISIIWIWSAIGAPRLDLRVMGMRLREGIGFSFAGTTQAVYNDIDKTMLAHFGMNRENGFYSLAYRVVDFATTPIVALDSAILPRYFYFSRQGMTMIGRLALRPIGAALVIGGIMVAGIRLAGPIVTVLSGHDFRQVVVALQWLCWLPLLRAVHMITGSALTGTGHQNLRTTAQVSVAIVNIGLNLLWIPRIGWTGAARSSVLCDGLLAIMNAGFLLYEVKLSTRLAEVAAVAEGKYIAQ